MKIKIETIKSCVIGILALVVPPFIVFVTTALSINLPEHFRLLLLALQILSASLIYFGMTQSMGALLKIMNKPL